MRQPQHDGILVLKDGRRLGYGEYGDLAGWPLMFLHGTPGSRMMAQFAAARARELGIRLIAPERPGFGLSDIQPQRRLLDWAADVRELADAMDLERFVLAGVSGGGPYVAAFAWKMPERCIAAGLISSLAPMGRVKRGLRRRYWLAAALVRRRWLVNLVLGLPTQILRRHPELIINILCLAAPRGARQLLSHPEVRRTQLDGIPETFRHGVQGVAWELALLSQPWGFDVKEIQVPMLLWHGEADAIVPVGMGRYLADQIPRCQARFIPGAGHLWILEGYEEVFRALRPYSNRAGFF